MAAKIHLNLNQKEDRSYDVMIGMNFAEIAEDIHRMIPRGKCFVICDENVAKYHSKKLTSLMTDSGMEVDTITIPAGEEHKTRQMKDHLEDRLLELHADRQSTIIALGGGVIGDLAGFVAATFQRGIPFIQIPTTLLAQVDASIGGKVAVDHPMGKNLIGAFYQPLRVYIDTSTLSTLPEKEFRNGMAEVIKYAAILDSRFFAYLENNHARITGQDKKVLNKIVTWCCRMKKDIVEQDEKETGLRRILNFGHTIGHAIERLQKYHISHGEAISIGMVAEAQLFRTLGYMNMSAVIRLRSLLTRYGLPVELPQSISIDDLVNATLTDKKAAGDVINYTLLEEIGKAKVGVGLTIDQVRRSLNK
jgi:3-dehydroquinate synthase